MLSKRRLAVGGLSALFFVTGCTTSGSLLVVDLRTDLVSEVEFDAVRLELLDDDASGSFERHDAMAGADYVAGVRIGELLVEGSQAYLRVALLRHGVTVAERPVLVSMHGATAVTVVIGRDCRGVSCPGSADDPSQTACLAGHCVDPSCVEEAPQTCEPECSADADCPAPAAACAHAVCTAGGACLFGEIDGACGADAYCVPTIGCVSRPAPDSGGDCDANGNCVCPPNAVCDSELHLRELQRELRGREHLQRELPERSVRPAMRRGRHLQLRLRGRRLRRGVRQRLPLRHRLQ